MVDRCNDFTLKLLPDMLGCHKMPVQTLDVRQLLDMDIRNFLGMWYDVVVVVRTD